MGFCQLKIVLTPRRKFAVDDMLGQVFTNCFVACHNKQNCSPPYNFFAVWKPTNWRTPNSSVFYIGENKTTAKMIHLLLLTTFLMAVMTMAMSFHEAHWQEMFTLLQYFSILKETDINTNDEEPALNVTTWIWNYQKHLLVQFLLFYMVTAQKKINNLRTWQQKKWTFSKQFNLFILQV